MIRAGVSFSWQFITEKLLKMIKEIKNIAGKHRHRHQHHDPLTGPFVCFLFAVLLCEVITSQGKELYECKQHNTGGLKMSKLVI